jgi:hypothetical protein
VERHAAATKRLKGKVFRAYGTISRRGLPVAVAATAAATATWVTTPHAGASFCDPPLNGTFNAVSDGVWAKTNDVFHDETPLASTWTISTSCTANFPDCAGTVTSSQGWSAPMKCEAAGMWYVRRHLDHWEHCHDGGDAPGDQLYYFSPQLSGAPSYTSIATFTGMDRTVGPSGGCGINMPLVIEIPFKLTKT